VNDSAPAQRTHPLDLVSAALGADCGSVADIARTTGMTTEETMAALTALASIGRVRLMSLSALSCPAEGCSWCGTRAGCPLGSPATAADLHVWQVQPRR
jgi:hypothetical protein